jgi:hypothetical protein
LRCGWRRLRQLGRADGQCWQGMGSGAAFRAHGVELFMEPCRGEWEALAPGAAVGNGVVAVTRNRSSTSPVAPAAANASLR